MPSTLKAAAILLSIWLLNDVSFADMLEHAPGWSLSSEEFEDGNRKRYFLDPPDGRPTIAVTEDAAARLTAGTINPEDLYKDKTKKSSSDGKEQLTSQSSISPSSRDSPSTAGAANTSGSTGGSGSNYVRFNSNGASQSTPNTAPTVQPGASIGSPTYNSQTSSSRGGESEPNETKAATPSIIITEKKISDVSVNYVTSPTPAPAQETKTFQLGSTTCNGGYCSCHDKNHARNQGQADEICKDYKYKSAVSFETTNGPKRRRQCFGGLDGTGCFINAYSGNLICTSVTCSK